MTELVRRYHLEVQEPTDDALDAALGLPPQRWTPSAEHDAVHARFPGESVVKVPTPYPVCRTLFTQLTLTERDVFIDLGCGAGRVVLYGASVSPARFVGIELVPEWAALARRAAGAHARVRIVQGNALDMDLDEATVIYAFRPFSVETEATMVDRLQDLARRRAITIAAHRMVPSVFDPKLFEPTWLGSLTLLRSSPPSPRRRPGSRRAQRRAAR